MALPLLFLQKILYPISRILVKSTNLIDENISRKSSLSITSLSQAVNITSDTAEAEKKFLKILFNSAKQMLNKL